MYKKGAETGAGNPDIFIAEPGKYGVTWAVDVQTDQAAPGGFRLDINGNC
jgi:hypothetical protein